MAQSFGWAIECFKKDTLLTLSSDQRHFQFCNTLLQNWMFFYGHRQGLCPGVFFFTSLGQRQSLSLPLLDSGTRLDQTNRRMVAPALYGFPPTATPTGSSAFGFRSQPITHDTQKRTPLKNPRCRSLTKGGRGGKYA